MALSQNIQQARDGTSQAYRNTLKEARHEGKEAGKHPKFTGEPPSKVLYMLIGLLALCKDLLDLAVGWIPGVALVLTVIVNLSIWFLFLFDKSGGKQNRNSHFTRSFGRGIALILVTLFEGILNIVNFLPVETGLIIALYILATRAYKKAKKEAEKESKSRSALSAMYGYRMRRRQAEQQGAA